MAKRVEQILEKFRSGVQPTNPQKLIFKGVGNKDVYNITAPFTSLGETIIAGREENRNSELSQVRFFKRIGDQYSVIEDLSFDLQDPFFAMVHGKLVIGGVEVFPHPDDKDKLWWRTVFYRGNDIYTLKRFATGPIGMKDIRLVELFCGRIGVFTRPQGDIGKRGKIGYVEINSINDLNSETIAGAMIFTGQIDDEEWGGVNEAHLLKNGKVGLLGHISRFDEKKSLHYYAMEFCFDPVARKITDINIIAERNNFLESEAKRPDLVDVIFSGGLVRNKDGTAYLYAGISDVEAQYVKIADPFIKYEENNNIRWNGID